MAMKKFKIQRNTTLFQSAACACAGLMNAIRTESKVRQVVIAAFAVTAVSAWLDVGYFQILMIVFSWVVALICEMFNTALEKALDYASGTEYHPLIRDGKDYASACTFIAILFASTLALIVWWGRFYASPSRF